MNTTTLTRFRNDEERGGTLALATLSAVSQHTGIPLPAEARGDLAEQGAFKEPEAIPYRSEMGDARAELVAAYLKQHPSLFAMTVRARTLEYRGIKPGDVLIMDMNAQPLAGDVVVAQFYDWQSPQQAETVLRLYMPPVLMTAGIEGGEIERPRLIEDRSVGIKGVMLVSLGGRQGRMAA
ncbi:hypothetical protein [Bosea minatitlanensis]|uniref:Peptidase S24/S26A/S26B/S26C domain-containing protein n=1 Tax=Bosea minatitlanensis TaxID=128782 RepID=A0ABW0EXS8_9HYPH|nr:hypothetical protein [Bosea minatitlanensis]MCT4496042.1 hypothetical protein [Bosea minatitlanensis]